MYYHRAQLGFAAINKICMSKTTAHDQPAHSSRAANRSGRDCNSCWSDGCVLQFLDCYRLLLAILASSFKAFLTDPASSSTSTPAFQHPVLSPMALFTALSASTASLQAKTIWQYTQSKCEGQPNGLSILNKLMCKNVCEVGGGQGGVERCVLARHALAAHHKSRLTPATHSTVGQNHM